VNWHPEEGQPGPGRGLAILAMALALALALLGAATLYVELAARSAAVPAGWVPAEVAAWLRADALPVLAGGALLVGLFGVLAVGAARRGVAAVPSPELREDETVERLRRQVEPLATGDLAVWLPETEGALGEIHRTLNLLIGGVSDLVAAAEDASVQLLGAVQDGRGGLANLKVEAERGRQLADEMLEHARHALTAARALGSKTRSRDSSAKDARAPPTTDPAADQVVHTMLRDRLDGIAEVIRDLAEQAHAIEVGVSVQAAAADAPAALRGVADDVGVLAEQAGRAVGRIGPLVEAALEESRSPLLDERAFTGPDRVVGGSAAGRRMADQVAALAELAASLRTSADRITRARDEAAASLGAFADLAQRLRRATGRFRLPG
jgi:methyl-accepting chemotaxis protein